MLNHGLARPEIAPPPLLFGPFELHPASGELFKSGELIRLAPQPARVLVFLASRAGQLVTREEIRAEIWNDGTVVEFDQGLNYCIRQIRLVLAEDAKQPQYIETVPKRGYRFIAPIRSDAPAASGFPGWAWLFLACLAIGMLLLAISHEKPLTGSAEADRLYLEAESLAATWEPDTVGKAIQEYEQVTHMVPDFARAWAGLANAEVVMTHYNSSEAALEASEMHARRAVELDPSSPVALAALGHSFWHQHRWNEAGAAFEKAVAGNPTEASPYHLYSMYLASRGRSEEAIAAARRSLEIAPTASLMNYVLAEVYFYGGDYEHALAQARRTLEFSRHYPLAYLVVVRANAMLGRLDDASAAFDEGVRVGDLEDSAWNIYLLALRGQKEEARRQLQQWRPEIPQYTSMAYVAAQVALGDFTGALNSIKTSEAPSMIWLKVAPELEPLRSDPRFAAALQRIGNP